MDLLIKNGVIDGKVVTISIDNRKIIDVIPAAEVSDNLSADTVIDAAGMLVVPSLKNGHTHAAMTLLRGFADDMKLQPWLEQKIWPAEAQLRPEDIYWGTRLGALEMIKTGTTFCNDMYFHFSEAWKAFHDAGMKAAVGSTILDQMNTETAARAIEQTKQNFQDFAGSSEKLMLSPAPHAVYTVSEPTLRWISDFSRSNSLIVHIHISETEQEVMDCLAVHGKRPVEYLDSIGFLGPHVVAAHCVWLSETEMDILANHQVTVVHNPVSNMKLAAGSCFQFEKLSARGVPMMLGTDGCSSNNNLDMFEEMKIAALLQKHHFNNPERMKSEEAFSLASGGETRVYPFLSSSIEAGAFADLLLINPAHQSMTPRYNTVSNLVYSCSESAVDTVICDGDILMQNRRVPGEDKIIEEAGRCADELKLRTGEK